jgi:hypothetical protein
MFSSSEGRRLACFEHAREIEACRSFSTSRRYSGELETQLDSARTIKFESPKFDLCQKSMPGLAAQRGRPQARSWEVLVLLARFKVVLTDRSHPQTRATRSIFNSKSKDSSTHSRVLKHVLREMRRLSYAGGSVGHTSDQNSMSTTR